MKIDKRVIEVTIPNHKKLTGYIKTVRSQCFKEGTRLMVEPSEVRYKGSIKVRRLELNGEKSLSLQELNDKIRSFKFEPATIEVLMALEGSNPQGETYIASGTILQDKKGDRYMPILGWDYGENVDWQVFCLIDMQCVWDRKKLEWVRREVKFGYKCGMPYAFPYREAVMSRGIFLAVERQ